MFRVRFRSRLRARFSVRFMVIFSVRFRVGFLKKQAKNKSAHYEIWVKIHVSSKFSFDKFAVIFNYG